MRKQLWGGQFWSDGYYIASVGVHANAGVIGRYVREQGTPENDKKLHEQQLNLFDFESALPSGSDAQTTSP